jgi:hypothetical protein
MGANFLGQNKVRCWESNAVCEACCCVTAWTTPMAMPVPGAELIAAANAEKKAVARAKKLAEGGKLGKERDLGWRLFSVLYEAGEVLAINKAGKPRILEWLRRPHKAPWFAAIADSGQKHVVPWCPVNAGPIGRVLFEERELTLGDFALVDDTSALLTAGATKDEIASGQYEPRTWMLCPDAIDAFEARWSHERASSWFELSTWLAQRNEAAVAARMEAESARRIAAKNSGRSDGGSSDRGAGGVPRKRGKRAEALGPIAGPDQGSGTNDEQPGRVDDVTPTATPTREPKQRQRSLF